MYMVLMHHIIIINIIIVVTKCSIIIIIIVMVQYAFFKICFLIAENVAKQWKVSRQNQDEFALSSQNRAERAQKDGHFNDELISIPVKIRKGNY